MIVLIVLIGLAAIARKRPAANGAHLMLQHWLRQHELPRRTRRQEDGSM
jgi:hypothetical protein